jgi:hypothetical protein
MSASAATTTAAAEGPAPPVTTTRPSKKVANRSSSSSPSSRMLAVSLLAAAVSLLAPTLAAAECPVSMTYYPPGTQNLPTAWSKANQTAAGNDRDDAMLPIALYGIPAPRLNAQPLSPVLSAPGTIVPGACVSNGAAVTRRRRLHQAAGAAPGAAAVSGLLAVPASYSFSWSVDGGPPTEGQGGPAFNATTGAPLFPSVELNVWDLADGPHTLTMSMVIAAKSGNLADGRPIPSADLTVSRTAVFYKMVARPTATVAFNTCTPAFGVQMTDMWPDAVPMVDVDNRVVRTVRADGVAAPAAFLRPVYHVWGRFQTGLDGKPFEGEDNEATGEWHFFDRYFVREIGAPSTLFFDKKDLVPGMYELSVEGSLTSDYPSLVALAGPDVFGQNGTVYTSVGEGGVFSDTDLLGKSKTNGAFVGNFNNTKVGVQRSRTALLAFAGPGAPPAVGDSIELSWAFHGLGNTTCALDGVPRGNSPVVPSPPGACVSPYVVRIADSLNHTLAVTFDDVCGNRRTETHEYGAGVEWRTAAQLDGLAMVDSALELQDPMMAGQMPGGGRVLATGRARNGAGGGARADAAAAAAALLAGGVGVLLLAAL